MVNGESVLEALYLCVHIFVAITCGLAAIFLARDPRRRTSRTRIGGTIGLVLVALINIGVILAHGGMWHDFL
ncbi:hypothetical protein LZC95_05045 [Pendulispora brunnea]|uniref:Uncharacterized protein n=1 Tax=Pendulispora brunnea TaxID=2905690 RepID=A0ABZ2KIN9_9BACT